MAVLTEKLMMEAEVYHGDNICRQKLSLLLTNFGLPNGLIACPEIEEYGFVKAIGLIWLRHRGDRIERRVINNVVVSYDTHVTAYVEPNGIRKLTGVRAKEFLIWVDLSEIRVRKLSPEVITFKTSVGLSRSFPVSVFE